MLEKAAGRLWLFCKRTGLDKFIVPEKEIKKLAVGMNAEKEAERNGKRTLKYLIMALAATVLLCAAAAVSTGTGTAEQGYLLKPSPGEGRKTYTVSARRELTGETVSVDVPVDEVKLTGEALELMFEEVLDYVEKAVLGDNGSPDSVSGSLDLVESVPGTCISVEWQDLDLKYLFSNGTVRSDTVTEPTVVIMTASLKYFDEERIRMFPVCLVPEEEEGESFTERALRSISAGQDDGADRIMLPESVEGEPVSWSSRDGSTPLTVVLLGLAAAALVIPAGSSRLKQQAAKRDEQLMSDYPNIISKLTLLLSAGMTCRGAWERICRDYERDRDRDKRYAYEEMLVTENELKLGTSELSAYEHFGSRCGLAPYRKLAVILTRNLKRGSRDMIALLEIEADEALEARREQVKIKAEEAGTKLLFPMMGMLIIVVAIVVVPAFMSFS